MKRVISLTADGSHTIVIPEMKVSYHSKHGAVAESRHVYINAGLLPLLQQERSSLKILETGFGTGLNALLSWQEAAAHKKHIHYTAVELFPLTEQEVQQINYGSLLSMEKEFISLNTTAWEKDISLDTYFTLHKKNISISDLRHPQNIDLIYFDAFAFTAQPELWSQAVFENMYSLLVPGGMLVTYSSKSIIRHAMTAAGFSVNKIPGPHGKREMVIAEKTN